MNRRDAAEVVQPVAAAAGGRIFKSLDRPTATVLKRHPQTRIEISVQGPVCPAARLKNENIVIKKSKRYQASRGQRSKKANCDYLIRIACRFKQFCWFGTMRTPEPCHRRDVYRNIAQMRFHLDYRRDRERGVGGNAIVTSALSRTEFRRNQCPTALSNSRRVVVYNPRAEYNARAR